MTVENVIRADDPTIADEDELWRRVHPRQVVRDNNRGMFRVSSAAFTDSSNGHPMSVYIAALVLASGRMPDALMAAHRDYSLAGFAAGVARSVGLGVVQEIDPSNPEETAHGVVFGKKTGAVKRKLASASRWVVPPRLDAEN